MSIASAVFKRPLPYLPPLFPLLFIIPCIFLILSFYNLSIQGPFFSFENIDPSYAYLFNGFELLHFHAPGHVDHPGTTTQLFMSFIILFKWLYTVCYSWFNQQPLPSLDHLFYTQADDFLYAGASALILINFLLFSLLSLRLFKHTKTYLSVFALQLGLFVFFPVLATYSLFTPEPMLLTGALFLGFALLPVLIKNQENNLDYHINFKYPKRFGLALGFGMATKITFLPLGLLLFFYPKTHWKKIILFALVSFLLCTFPIWGRYSNMLKWIVNIMFHQGIYGSGADGIIDPAKIFTHFKTLLNDLPFFFMSMGGLFSYVLLTYKKNTPILNRFLILSLGAMLFSLLLNLKHPGIRYMIPVLLLCPLLFAILAYEFAQKNRFYKIGLFSFIFLGLSLCFSNYLSWHQKKHLETHARNAFQGYIATNHCKVIGFYHPSMQSYALHFGNQWASKKRTRILSQYYPNSIFFNADNATFYDFNGPSHHLLDPQQVENTLKLYSCVVFQGMHALSLPKESPYYNRLLKKSLDNHQSIAGSFYEFIV